MDYTEIIPWIILALLILGGLVLAERRKSGKSSWFDTLFGWMIEPFVRERGPLEKGSGRRRGPDMAYSAGRDAAHQNTRLRQVFIPMEPPEEAALRAFYLTELGLDEMRAPNSHLGQDGFWAIAGTRQIYLGTMPDFKIERGEIPAFPIRNIRDVSDRLTASGYDIQWDRTHGYVERLLLIDPAGNQVALIAA